MMGQLGDNCSLNVCLLKGQTTYRSYLKYSMSLSSCHCGYREGPPFMVGKMQESLYVDDLVSGTFTVSKAIKCNEARRVLSAAGMNLRK